ncbi:hypothetical protein EV702DRAFT_1075716 [Suillus placidus]|uniref:Secreted protein n=1 Tax=Suillus placidus TaxID=48579 RepID=A0A9P7A3J8_9AGAM|nr:hypothetical protein EV702DRAFT_1075716 [Suillus placidus]
MKPRSMVSSLWSSLQLLTCVTVCFGCTLRLKGLASHVSNRYQFCNGGFSRPTSRNIHTLALNRHRHNPSPPRSRLSTWQV